VARGRFGRYATVSTIAVCVTQVCLVTAIVVVGLDAAPANIVAVSIASIPSYLLNRYWTWGKRSPNRFLTEVLPFWVMAITGLGLSTGLVVVADRMWDHVATIMAANLSGFGIVWVGRYMILDKVLFGVAARAEAAEGRADPALPEPDSAPA
jgi:putative flippase GtrA